MKLNSIILSSAVVREIQNDVFDHVKWKFTSIGVPAIEAARNAMAASEAMLAEISRDSRFVIKDKEDEEPDSFPTLYGGQIGG